MDICIQSATSTADQQYDNRFLNHQSIQQPPTQVSYFYDNNVSHQQPMTSMLYPLNEFSSHEAGSGSAVNLSGGSSQSRWSTIKSDSYLNSYEYTTLTTNYSDTLNNNYNQIVPSSTTTSHYSSEDLNREFYTNQTDYNYSFYHRNDWQSSSSGDTFCHQYNYGGYYDDQHQRQHQQENFQDKLSYYPQSHYAEHYDTRVSHCSNNNDHYPNNYSSSNNNELEPSRTNVIDRGHPVNGFTDTKSHQNVWIHSNQWSCDIESYSNVVPINLNDHGVSRGEDYLWSVSSQQHHQHSQNQQQQQQQLPPLKFKTLMAKSASKTNNSSVTSVQRANQCEVCGRNYARPSTLKTHLRTHTNERPFKCDVCFKTFSQAANLTAHQRVHTGERPFSCPICGRQFSQSSSVITHLRTHSGERPYRCSMCSRTFSDSSTLTKHCRIHSGEKPYQCDYCPLNFSQSGNLSRHLKLHMMSTGSTSSSSGSSNQSSSYNGVSKTNNVSNAGNRHPDLLPKRSQRSQHD